MRSMPNYPTNDEGVDLRNLTVKELVEEIRGAVLAQNVQHITHCNEELRRRGLTVSQAMQIAEED